MKQEGDRAYKLTGEEFSRIAKNAEAPGEQFDNLVENGGIISTLQKMVSPQTRSLEHTVTVVLRDEAAMQSFEQVCSQFTPPIELQEYIPSKIG